jgi:GWxTD domain-containing protein
VKKILPVILIFASISSAQIPIFRPFFSTTDRELGKLFFFEVINLISEDTSKSRVDINFRVANALLSFIKNPLSSPTYTASFTVSVEIFGKDGKSIARKIFRGFRGTNKYEETTSKDYYTQGNFRFDLSPGNYRLILIFDDENSNRTFKRERSINLKSLKPNSFEIADLVIIQDREEKGDTVVLIPTNIGNRVNFGKGFTAYIQFSDKPSEVEYTLTYFPEFRKKEVILNRAIDAKEIKNDKRFIFRENPGDTIFTYLLVPSSAQNYYSLLIPIKGDSLDLGEYELSFSVKFKDSINNQILKTFTKRFTVEWIDMPFSLQNLDYAIEILEYIATPDEMAKLRFGTPQARLQKFKEFWARRDPTPNTIYNELMAEYYRRVDYAYLNFTTMRDRDGAKTDRGRIYILYGEPTKTERKYTPGRPTEEIWYYDTIGRKFVFTEQYGSFKLTSVENYVP